MNSVVITDPGVFLGKTSERLVVRGPKPAIDFVDGGPQLLLPLVIPPRPRLAVVTSDGAKGPPPSIRRFSKERPQTTPDQVELPLFRVSEIVVASSGVSLSSDLIEECCERGIRVAFLSRTGRPYAMLSSPMLTATVATRRQQMAAYGDTRGVAVARSLVFGKLGNQAALLKYFGKYKKQVDPEGFTRLTQVIRSITALRRQAKDVTGDCIDDCRTDLLAVEGAAGRHYWAGIRQLLDGHAEFATREHRGATDSINAALNYGYGILYSQVWGAIMNAGLEPFAGFMHVDRPGKPSLVLDLVEEFRQPIVDRSIVAAATRGTVFAMHGGMLTDEARRAVAGVVTERLESEVAFRGRRYRARSLIQIQTRNLASFLRGGAAYRSYSFKW